MVDRVLGFSVLFSLRARVFFLRLFDIKRKKQRSIRIAKRRAEGPRELGRGECERDVSSLKLLLSGMVRPGGRCVGVDLVAHLLSGPKVGTLCTHPSFICWRSTTVLMALSTSEKKQGRNICQNCQKKKAQLFLANYSGSEFKK